LEIALSGALVMVRKFKLDKTHGLAWMKPLNYLMILEVFYILRISSCFGMQKERTIITLVDFVGSLKVFWD
jgi:hypothetical protein